MLTLKPLVTRARKYGARHQPLYLGSAMLFFWAVFDGIISFIAPLLIVGEGFSETQMGLIIGTSSLAGMIFDFFLCRVLKNTNFRRIYLLLLLLCVIQPLILWQAKSAWLFILAMIIWGLYYDLSNIGDFDFVVRIAKKAEHAASFGVLRVFIALGYLLAPLIVGLVIFEETVGFSAFALAWLFLGLAIILFGALWWQTRGKNHRDLKFAGCGPQNFLTEFYLWKKIGNYILPVLVLTFMLNIIDAFFWTIGPLVSESLSAFGVFGSLFMVAYTLPSLFAGWFVGNLAHKLGQKRTAFLALFFGALILSLMGLTANPGLMVAISFFASFFISFSAPAICGAYADYIAENPAVEKDIEAMQDSFTNLGFIIGPVLAGFASQHLGHGLTFSLLGLLSAAAALLLLKFTPKKINLAVKVKNLKLKI